MTHFVCKGTCGGESERAGTCQSPDCTMHDQPLEACNCRDGKHLEIKQPAPAQE